MAAYDLQEQEQIDNIKALWKQWGPLVMTVLLAAVLGIVGSKVWSSYKLGRAEAASAQYVLLEKTLQTEDLANAQKQLAVLKAEYAGSPYASRGALLLARTLVTKKDLKAAQEQLQWVLQQSKEDDLKDLTRMRLAAVRLDQKQYAEALKTLEAKPIEAFVASFAELKGDIMLASGKTADAAKAYEIAINKIDKESPQYRFLQLKVDALEAAK
jgi:predicted negative regulator of RcsB-dependent stress response